MALSAPATEVKAPRAAARTLATRVRLISGLVLFVFAATHLLNHSLGIISTEVLDEGRRYFIKFWRHPIPAAVLYASLVAHVVLTLAKTYARRTWRMAGAEYLQLLLAFGAVPFLATHLERTRLANLSGVRDTYAYVLLQYLPPGGPLFLLGLTVALWVHGCLGLHLWLRFKTWFPPISRVLYTVAVLLPVLSFVGTWQQWDALHRKVQADPAAAEPLLTRARAAELTPEESARNHRIALGVMDLLGAALAGVAVVAGVRFLLSRRRTYRVSWVGGTTATIPVGATLLEASRLARVQHASLCGGRGRCSTCRVRITEGMGQLPPPAAPEARVLAQLRAPPEVRLACQVRPTTAVTMEPLVHPLSLKKINGRAPSAVAHGEERELVILFADLRGFTRLSEAKLPYDVVFVLNRYCLRMGQAIEQSGGYLDKFIGDGVMALFGLRTDPRTASREALRAARAMSEALEALNRELAGELKEPLRVGIGIHVGHAIVAEIGYGRANSLTAIGDSVNTASRLESKCAELGAQLVLSQALADRSGVDLTQFKLEEVALKGRESREKVRVIRDARELPAIEPEPGEPLLTAQTSPA